MKDYFSEAITQLENTVFPTDVLGSLWGTAHWGMSVWGTKKATSMFTDAVTILEANRNVYTANVPNGGFKISVFNTKYKRTSIVQRYYPWQLLIEELEKH